MTVIIYDAKRYFVKNGKIQSKIVTERTDFSGKNRGVIRVKRIDKSVGRWRGSVVWDGSTVVSAVPDVTIEVEAMQRKMEAMEQIQSAIETYQ